MHYRHFRRFLNHQLPYPQGNRKIAFTVKTGVAIRHRKAGRNFARMETVLGFA